MAANLGVACSSLLNSVRASGLNFCLNETPFSIYLTVRKSFIQSKSPNSLPEALQKNVEISQTKFEDLLRSHENLEKVNLRMKNDFADVLDDCDEKEKVIKGLKTNCGEKADRIKILESQIIELEQVNKSMETKSEKISKENKSLKQEISESNSELKITKKEVKNLEKENRDTGHEFVKKIEALEYRNKHLVESHAAEVRKEKNDIKTVNKKLKKIEEKEAKFEIEKTKFEKARNIKIPRETKVCQTDESPDVPYNITTPLPPIFSSQLCHATPPIRFLSRSLPRLDKISWCQPEDYMVDEADEYLNYQYDQEIKQFYVDARNKAIENKGTDENMN